MKTTIKLFSITSVLCLFCLATKSQTEMSKISELKMETFSSKNSSDSSILMIKLLGPINSKILFTTDGTEPTKKSPTYTQPFAAKSNCTVKAIAYVDKKKIGAPLLKQIYISRASAKKVKLVGFSITNSTGDSTILTNGLHELEIGPKAIAWEGVDATLIIDMEKLKKWTEMSISCAIDKTKLCYPALAFELFYSQDNQVFNAAVFDKPEIADKNGLRVYKFKLTAPAYGRYVKMIMYNAGPAKNESNGENQKTWIIIDEVSVD